MMRIKFGFGIVQSRGGIIVASVNVGAVACFPFSLLAVVNTDGQAQGGRW